MLTRALFTDDSVAPTIAAATVDDGELGVVGNFLCTATVV